MKKTLISILLLVALILAGCGVTVPDPNLRIVIANHLGIPVPADGVFTFQQMQTLVTFDATWSGIHDITGLQAATNIEHLYLGDNYISDISPLQNLTKITFFSIYNNDVSDISPLANCVNMEFFNGMNNPIDDDAFDTMENWLGEDSIYINLSGTYIYDLMPLLYFQWDPHGVVANFVGCPLSDYSCVYIVNALQALGWSVQYSCY